MPDFSDTTFDRLPLQAKLRIDAVCERFEAAWAAGSPLLEAFRSEVPTDEQPVLLAELLHIEIERRRKAGESPVAEDYLGRFPEDATLIHMALPPSAQPAGCETETRPNVAGVPDPAVPAPSAHRKVSGYDVLEELGRGGMGVVHKARHLALNRFVALKFILAGRQGQQRQEDRFRREAEVIAKLRHPNIIQIYDIGEVGGSYYLALEHADAGSLRDWLDGVPEQPRLAALLLEPLARAVQHAHRQGVIHRDIKPANILLTSSGDSVMAGNRGRPEPVFLFQVPRPSEGLSLSSLTPKLTDFGLAQLIEHEAAGEAGIGAGTPNYMAPEQILGETNCGPAADVWALGATLYELLTGHPPFTAPTVNETFRLILAADPVPPCQLLPSVPRDLETICLKCLRKEPAARYPGARELAHDLQRFLAGEGIQARRAGRVERLRKWVRRRPGTALLMLLLILSLTAGVGGVTAAMLHAFAGWEKASDSERAALTSEADARLAHEHELAQRVTH